MYPTRPCSSSSTSLIALHYHNWNVTQFCTGASFYIPACVSFTHTLIFSLTFHSSSIWSQHHAIYWMFFVLFSVFLWICFSQFFQTQRLCVCILLDQESKGCDVIDCVWGPWVFCAVHPEIKITQRTTSDSVNLQHDGICAKLIYILWIINAAVLTWDAIIAVVWLAVCTCVWTFAVQYVISRVLLIGMD